MVVSLPFRLSLADASPVRSHAPRLPSFSGVSSSLIRTVLPCSLKFRGAFPVRLVQHERDLGVAVLLLVVRLADGAGGRNHVAARNGDDRGVRDAAQIPPSAARVGDAEAHGGVVLEPVGHPQRELEGLALGADRGVLVIDVTAQKTEDTFEAKGFSPRTAGLRTVAGRRR